MDEAGTMTTNLQLMGVSRELVAYLPFFYAGLLSLAVPVLLWFISSILRSNQNLQQGSSSQRNQMPDGAANFRAKKQEGERSQTGRRLNSRFFVGTIIAHLFLGLTLLMVPLAFRMGFPVSSSVDRFKILLVVLSLAALILLGLLYGSGKGDLLVLKTFKPLDDPRNER